MLGQVSGLVSVMRSNDYGTVRKINKYIKLGMTAIYRDFCKGLGRGVLKITLCVCMFFVVVFFCYFFVAIMALYKYLRSSFAIS